jgi:hypothetical protein
MALSRAVGFTHGSPGCFARQGTSVYVPTLTGLGECSHLTDRAINLDTHIQDIVNVFVYEGITDAILCRSSYGGMVITGQ